MKIPKRVTNFLKTIDLLGYKTGALSKYTVKDGIINLHFELGPRDNGYVIVWAKATTTLRQIELTPLVGDTIIVHAGTYIDRGLEPPLNEDRGLVCTYCGTQITDSPDKCWNCKRETVGVPPTTYKMILERVPSAPDEVMDILCRRYKA